MQTETYQFRLCRQISAIPRLHTQPPNVPLTTATIELSRAECDRKTTGRACLQLPRELWDYQGTSAAITLPYHKSIRQGNNSRLTTSDWNGVSILRRNVDLHFYSRGGRITRIPRWPSGRVPSSPASPKHPKYLSPQSRHSLPKSETSKRITNLIFLTSRLDPSTRTSFRWKVKYRTKMKIVDSQTLLILQKIPHSHRSIGSIGLDKTSTAFVSHLIAVMNVQVLICAHHGVT